MLKVGITKKSQPLRVVDYLLVNWEIRNNEIYFKPKTTTQGQLRNTSQALLVLKLKLLHWYLW